MVLRDGNKYACESCIRGHRVTGCNHTDRELHFIAPKGRPVKQCEHCRGARKSKSHHARCDCGGKKERNEVKLDDKECCCNLGDSCVCGIKGEDGVLGSESSHRSAHTRPHPSKHASDGHLTTYINSKHKACHKWDVAQSHGPYPRPKLNPSGCHSSSPNVAGAHTPGTDTTGTPQANFSQDDWHLPRGSSSIGLGFTSPSLDSLPLSFLGGDPFRAPQTFGAPLQQVQGRSPGESDELYTIPSNDSVSATYLQELMFANANANTSPSNELQIQQGQPSAYRRTQDDFFDAEQASFGSNDLPLNSGSLTPDFAQPTAFTDDSAAPSAPGLTAASSTAPSELGDGLMFPETSADSMFDTAAFPMSIDYSNVNALNPNVATTTFNMPPPPTSDPSPRVSRRSLDAQALKSLSTFPAFDGNSTDYFAASAFEFSIDSSSNNVVNIASEDRSSTPAPSSDMKAPLLRPTSFEHSSSQARASSVTTAPRGFGDSPRPRSVTIPASHHYTTYNPNVVIDQMYPQLTQDFAAAADWDPNATAGGWADMQTFTDIVQ